MSRGAIHMKGLGHNDCDVSREGIVGPPRLIMNGPRWATLHTGGWYARCVLNFFLKGGKFTNLVWAPLSYLHHRVSHFCVAHTVALGLP
jgi:hypothetical protein